MERPPGTLAERVPLTWSAATAARGLFSMRAELFAAILAGALLLVGFVLGRVARVE